MIFDKGAKTIQQMVSGQLNIHIHKNEVELLPYMPTTKINSKWMIGLILRAKTIKLLEEDIGVNLYDLELGNTFLDMTLKV